MAAEPDDLPNSFDIGLISPGLRAYMLDVVRRAPATYNTNHLKKAAVDLLETATPSMMPPGKLDWEKLEKKRARFGPHWSLADMLERER